ncbi:MAG: hypothetical protein JWM10_2125 [Myxococcaceae bacterium]|nr:hypothetical protein [Myxococcaceae bacterium]
MTAPKRPDMVGWYDPAQLMRTGVQTVLTEAFATRADFRLLLALGEAQEPRSFADRDAFWFDYVSDTGDGWRPTTAVLHALAEPAIEVDGQSLPRGDLLVMGGDQVYPAGSVALYEERLLAPMRAVSPAEAPPSRPLVLAIPGNHDWYDGLVGFVNTFAQKGALGMWATFQTRSYHCLKLPHRHWLVAVDVQLQADLDVPQRRWFEGALKDLREGDHVIVCLAEPTWVFRQQYGHDHGPQLRALERYITEEKRARVVLWLAGDLHHYRRMARTDDAAKAQYVTAGGGGAFLHPTHTPSLPRLHRGRRGETRRFSVEAEYPSRAVSLSLARRNLAFPFLNLRFGFATAALYTLLSWLLPQPDLGAIDRGVGAAIRRGLVQVAEQPSAISLVVLLLVAVVYFTDSNRPLYRVGAGLVHGVAHLLGALAATAAGLWCARALGVQHDVVARRGVMIVASAVLGYGLGGMIMGLYLFVSVRVFHRHGNEAFSSLREEGWKNFLRVRVDASGLSLWAFGLDRMPAQWSDDPWPLPRDPSSAARPRVIDRVQIPAPIESRP